MCVGGEEVGRWVSSPCEAESRCMTLLLRHTGLLTGGSLCYMSNLRNSNVPCHFTGHITCRKCDVLMSHVKKKMKKGVPLVLQVMSLSSVWHGYFKKWLCHCGEFRGQWTCTERHLGHRREGYRRLERSRRC